MADDVNSDSETSRTRRVFGGRASRIEVYVLAVGLFVLAAGGISGAIVVASSSDSPTSAPLPAIAVDGDSVTGSTTVDASSVSVAPATSPKSASAGSAIQGSSAPSSSVANPPQLSPAEIAELQRQAQAALQEQANRDARQRLLQIDGCPPPPLPQTQAGWNDGLADPALQITVTPLRSGMTSDLEHLGYEISRVAHLGCVSVGLSSSAPGDGTATIYWYNVGLFTVDQMRTALRNLGWIS
jgi:hypothetical protein